MADFPAQKPQRLWRVILVLSLALNVAVVGIVAGLALRETGRGVSPRGFDMALGPIGRALDGDDRRAIGEALRRDPALRDNGRKEARRITEELVTVLRTSPFDEQALAAVVETASSRAERVQSAARDALVQRIKDMTDAERRLLADRIADKMGRKR